MVYFHNVVYFNTPVIYFHRMTVSVLKMHFRKLPPTIISYRDFYNYHNLNFINSLTEILFEGESTESFVKDPDCFY